MDSSEINKAKKMSSSWAEIKTPEATNLSEIMLEETAKKIQAIQDQKYFDKIQGSVNESYEVVNVSSDEFEYLPGDDDTDSDNAATDCDKSEGINEDQLYEGTKDISNKEDWDRIEALTRQIDGVPIKDLITNSDCSAANKYKDMMTDTENVSKILIEYLIAYKKRYKLYCRRNRLHYYSTFKNPNVVIGQFSRIIIHKLMTSEKLFKQINGIVGVGKKSLILHANSNTLLDRPLPQEVAIKVFKKVPYIRNDNYYWTDIDKERKRSSPKNEMAVLKRLAEIGVPCPEVFKRKNHVLLMSFIGALKKPAPTLADTIPQSIFSKAYKEVIQSMKLMYTEAKLVHGNLSEHKILFHQNKCYFIDFSQVCEITEENALYILLDDCKTIHNFFIQKIPKVNVLSPEELFQDITGVDCNDRCALVQEQDRLKKLPTL